MKKAKIKKVSLLSVLLVFVISVSVFFYMHPTHYKYKDRQIIGKTSDEIIEKYGEFDVTFGSILGYKINESITDSIWRYFTGGEPIEYYCIQFNENGTAEKIYKSSYPGGY